MSLESDISNALAHYWLEENRYCGMSSTEVFRRLSQKLSKPVTITDVRKVLRDMQGKGLVSTRQVQGEIYAYPKRPLLEPRDQLSKEDVGIYTKQLRLGGSQIEHRFFRRQVLDRYNQDPRYVVGDFGSSGSIFIRDEFYDDKDIPEADKVSIQTFGIGYRENGERIVAVIFLTWVGFQRNIRNIGPPSRFMKSVSWTRTMLKPVLELNLQIEFRLLSRLFKN